MAGSNILLGMGFPLILRKFALKSFRQFSNEFNYENLGLIKTHLPPVLIELVHIEQLKLDSDLQKY